MFNKDFTAEDAILYVMVAVILVFFGIMFVKVQPAGSSSDAAAPIWDYAPNETPLLHYINAHVAVSELRYRQAAKATASVTTRKNLGFLVGTIMAVLGSMLTIRGIREAPTSVGLEAIEVARVKLTSGSPGMILATLGCVIMVATIVTQDIVRVEDPEFRLDVAGASAQSQGGAANLEGLAAELRQLQSELGAMPEDSVPAGVTTNLDELLEELESLGPGEGE